MGDGLKAGFWVDKWLHSGIVLQSVALNNILDDDLMLPIAEFCLPNGEWDMSKFQHLLPRQVFLEVLSNLGTRNYIGPDCVSWAGTSNEAFSTHSAY